MASKPVNASSSKQHRSQASSEGAVDISLVTVSDSRTAQSDQNKHYLEQQIEQANHHLLDYRIVKDDPSEIENVLEELVVTSARVIIFNGGTGISKRDRTFDVIASKLHKTLPGFGEIFRMLSFNEIGAAAMLSRATAGVYKDTVIISLPGSPNAVQLAWNKLIAAEIQHLAWEIVR